MRGCICLWMERRPQGSSAGDGLEEFVPPSATLQDQDLHPSPQDTLCYWRCLRDLQTWAGWVASWRSPLGGGGGQRCVPTACIHLYILFTFHTIATRIQAKYKGYRVKGVFLKQKGAGRSSFPLLSYLVFIVISFNVLSAEGSMFKFLRHLNFLDLDIYHSTIKMTW